MSYYLSHNVDKNKSFKRLKTVTAGVTYMGMSDEQNQENGGIKIIDRRRFDSSGNDKDSEAEVTATKPVNKPAGPPVHDFITSEPPHEPESDISFSSLVMSLATQTLMQLGEMGAPEGVSVPVDVEGAKQTIEILSMLSLKTKNNLSKEEAQLLEEVLHNLRVGFVNASKQSPRVS